MRRVITWRNLKFGLSTTAHLPHDAFKEPLEQIEIVVEYSMKQHRSMRLQEQKYTDNIRHFSGILHLVSEGKHRADGYLIYGRRHEICPQCDAAHIKKTKVGSQPLYWCPNCQRIS